ncbi:MAG: Rv2993c-like domain-containing protein, partial [Hyphomicrobiales bacterium]
MMKIARYAHGPDVHYGILEDDRLVRLSASPFDGQIERSDTVDRLADVRLVCPVARPRIFGVGYNYLAHIREAGQQPPKIPTLFMKPDTAAIGSGEPIVYPLEGQN